jgi:IS1 family transposase
MGISHTSVYNWCKIYDQQVRMNYDISDKFTEDITEIEVDELYHKFTDGGNKVTKTLYYDNKGNIIHEKVEKEAQRIYVLTATDTKTGKQIDNKVVMTNTNEEIHNFLDEVTTKHPKITIIHSDGWSSYKSYCKKNEINHTNTKNLTHNVERNNGLMRDYLAEIKRRAKAVPHDISILDNRINTLFVLINNKVRSFFDFMKFNELYFSKPFNLCYQL